MTVSHGHLAFYGAYALVNLTFFYFAIPAAEGLPGGRYRRAPGDLGVLGVELWRCSG